MNLNTFELTPQNIYFHLEIKYVRLGNFLVKRLTYDGLAADILDRNFQERTGIYLRTFLKLRRLKTA